jgi:hypothetical protein
VLAFSLAILIFGILRLRRDRLRERMTQAGME